MINKIYCQNDSKDLIDAVGFVNLALEGIYDKEKSVVA